MPTYFTAPPAGRRILAGFSCLQRIGKGAQTQVWFPESLKGSGAQWAAVRQFELLQEAGNLAIDDLEVGEINKSFQALMRMRSGGYRLTLITLGDYAAGQAADELEILDQKLQEEITRMIHFLYLNEQSETASAQQACALRKSAWRWTDALPHIATALYAKRLYKPHKETLAEKVFFEILERLPQRHMVHDVAVGLVLPDATKEKNWVYLAKGEHKPAAFFAAIGAAMGEAINHHLRGYGDHITKGCHPGVLKAA